MTYCDYSYYVDAYGGDVLTAPQFEKYATKASSLIQMRTFGRVPAEAPDAVKRCTCELAEHLSIADNRDVAVASEKDGTWSATYADVQHQDAVKTDDIVNTWLIGTGYLYCGGGAV